MVSIDGIKGEQIRLTLLEGLMLAASVDDEQVCCPIHCAAADQQ
jgi:hypothetical protein